MVRKNIRYILFFKPQYSLCKNDHGVGGASAYGPKILLKSILFACSKGITSSREIQCCWCAINKGYWEKNYSPLFGVRCHRVQSQGRVEYICWAGRKATEDRRIDQESDSCQRVHFWYLPRGSPLPAREGHHETHSETGKRKLFLEGSSRIVATVRSRETVCATPE